MKYLKLFNESVKDNLEKQINDLLINKKIVADESKLVKGLPFRITSGLLEFTPSRFKIVGDSLKVYVPMNKVNGKISNPYNNFTEEQAKCMVMTAWIHWQITSKYLDTHFDIMVYPDNFS